MLAKSTKSAGIFIAVTEDFIKSLDEILASFEVQKLRTKGYTLDRSVLGRFGYLLVKHDISLLLANTDLLLSASSAESATEFLKGVQK